MGKTGGKISPATEFKPGKSGNPKGRPKAPPDLKELLANMLSKPVDQQRTAAEAILQAMYERALKGDTKAADLLLNRAYGKPKDNEGEPTEMIIRVQRNS